MRRLPLRLRLGLVGVLAGVVFAGTVGWGQTEYARAAALRGSPGVKESPAVKERPAGDKVVGTDAGTKPANGALRVQVEEGDTLFGIARGYGFDVGALLKANQGVEPDALQPGQELALPAMAFRSGSLSPDLKRYQGLFGWPLEAPLTSPFGPRWGRFHAGIDFAAEPGTTIRASRAGRVTAAGNLKDYGLTVILTHADGTRSLYGHCSAIRVQEGEKVEAGAIIAEVGSTGLSTGPHLHFEIRVDDEPLDPLLFLSR